jgi:NAD+ kinase
MKIAFLASAKPPAQQALSELVQRYGQSDLSQADYVVAIGGDGTALRALHAVLLTTRKPVFAMRAAGSLGLLANRFELAGLPQRLQMARTVTLHPLKADAEHAGGASTTVLAINEIVLMRQRLQAAKLRVAATGGACLAHLVGDGLLVATPIGSTGYNRSAGGPVLPQESSLLALTGLAVHRRSDWSNTIVSNSATIEVEVLEPAHRPVRLETSLQEVTDVSRVRISCDRDTDLQLLFDGSPSLRAPGEAATAALAAPLLPATH